jgi:hypothetical protein
MEISVDAARLLASIIPVGLLIIAVHARGLRRRIRVVPKPFAMWATVVVILLALASIALCVWTVDVDTPLGGAAAWFVVVSAVLLLVLTAGTFFELVVISMEEEEEAQALAPRVGAFPAAEDQALPGTVPGADRQP